jgi:anti-anti-sigma factor
MNIDKKETETEITFVLTDEFVTQNLPVLADEFTRFAKSDSRDAVIDLAFVQKLNSTAIAALIRFKNMLTEKGRSMLLVNTNENVLRVLELSGMDRFLLE